MSFVVTPFLRGAIAEIDDGGEAAADPEAESRLRSCPFGPVRRM